MAKRDLEKIIKDYQPGLQSFIRKNVGSDEDAEDILQDVFYQLVKNIEEESSIEHVSGWLYRVAKNMIINKGKKMRESAWPASHEDNEVLQDFSEILFNDDNPAPDVVYMRALVWEELEDALASLPPEQKEAFELTAIDGLPVKEVAEIMDVPVNTLLSRKHYAVKFLRKRLAGLYKDLLAF